MAAPSVPVTLDTPIAIKILFRGQTRKLKLPLKDLGANVLPSKLRSGLHVLDDETLIVERYSDSAGAYITLDSDKPQIYKTLFRAAKAKLKLRLRAHVPGDNFQLAPPPPPPEPAMSTPASTEATEASAVPEAPAACEAAAAPAAVTAPKSSAMGPSHPAMVPRPGPPVVMGLPDFSQGAGKPMTKAERLAATPLIVRSPETPKVEAAVHKAVVSKVEPPKVEVPHFEAVSPVSPPRHNAFSLQNILGPTIPPTEVSSPPAGLAFRPKPVPESNWGPWVVYCNNCNDPMDDEHYHCSVCDGGDYDLCLPCVDSGAHCPSSGHWMVKRFVKNGSVVNSTTHRLAAKTNVDETKPESESKAKVQEPVSEAANEVPGAFTDEKQSVYEQEPTRTCNCCINVLAEEYFVECTNCYDYDLCLECHVQNKHGHHPGHAFKAATSKTVLPTLAHALCTPGRNARHSAVCDGCEKFIYGIRHKCLNCPDWDYCSECVKSAKIIHPRHRFVPIYESLAEPLAATSRHFGIYCDGPLCKDRENQTYIEGVRFKCAVCNDTDFCHNCEAHPNNKHNHTHPLIKFKTPVRSVSVTTINDHASRNGSVVRLGDQTDAPATRSASTETKPITTSANAATQVQTIVDVKPFVAPVEKDAEPVADKNVPVAETKKEQLDAHFVRDTVADGMKLGANTIFTQTWTLRNPGPLTWPAGCSVRHVGGDNMLVIDNTRILTHHEIYAAKASNTIDVPVAPGTEVSFRVKMKVPSRVGTAISYWRLKTANGIPFGHRLWCDIDVQEQPYPLRSDLQPVAPPRPCPGASQQSSLESTETLLRVIDKMHQQTVASGDPSSSLNPSSKIPAMLSKTEKFKTDASEREKENTEKAEIKQTAREKRMEEIRAATQHMIASRGMVEQRRMHPAQAQYDAQANAQAWAHMQAQTQARVQAEAQAQAQHIKAEQHQSAELPVERKQVEKASEEHQPELQSSGMIFPQLDKESPESSTHEFSKIQPESPVSVKSTLAGTLTVASEEFFEDAESIALHSDDDGFMTDEEYDILDASDEEMR